VRQMGGRMWAHSEPGKGASFRIYLPRTEAEAQAVAPRGPATILLMERNDGLRTVLANILKKRGYHVLAARDATGALEIAEAQGPADLLIGEPEPELVERLAGLPVATLSKPFDPDMLLGAVARALSAP
jgi:hypothetical protein